MKHDEEKKPIPGQIVDPKPPVVNAGSTEQKNTIM